MGRNILPGLKMKLVPFLLFLFCCQTTQSRHVRTGNEFAKDGLLKEAVSSYQEALREDRRNWTAHRNLGLLLVKTGKYEKAIYYLEKSLPRFRRDFDTNFYLGEAYRAKEKFSEAIFRYRFALNIKPNAPQVLKSLGWTYYKINLMNEARQMIRKLLAIDADDYNGAIILARIYLKQKDYQKSLDVLRQYQQTANKNTLPYFQGIEGDIYLELNRVRAAAELYRYALKSNPLLPGALIGMGRIFLMQRQYRKAIRYLERAARLRPKNTQVHLLLGEALEPVDVRKSLKHYRLFRKLARRKAELPDKVVSVKIKIEALKKSL